MATFVLQKQQMVQGEERITEEFVLPSGLANVRIEIDLNTNELRDPLTHVRADLEWLDRTGPADFWRMVNAVTLVGNPDNDVRGIPFIQLSEQDCAFFAGQRLRGRIVAGSDGNYGATVRTE